jgi:copper chaperone
MVSMRIEIEGMTCGHCVGAVRNALETVEGVTVEAIDVGSATVTYDAVQTPFRLIAGAIENAGYSVSGEGSKTGH